MKQALLKNNGYGYLVYWEDGGQVPEALSGLYTSPTEANKAIEAYLKTRRTPKNAKATNRAK